MSVFGGRDWLKPFKEAEWASMDELRAWVESCTPMAPGDVRRLLDLLLDKKLAAQGSRHRNRCAAFAAVANRSLDRGLFGPLVKAIEPGDALLRQTLATLIPKVNDVDAHELLTQVLGRHDEEVRAVAKELLEKVGGPSALAALTKQVAAHDYAGRMEAMTIMVAKAKQRCLPLLGAVVAHGTPREQIAALRLIADPEITTRAHREAVDAIKAALSSPDRRVSTEAFRAFGRVVPEAQFFDELDSYIHGDNVDPAVIESLGAYHSDRALDVLRHRVLVGPAALRLAAVSALRTIGTDRAIPSLVLALQVDDVQARRRAIEALTELSTAGAVDIAVPVLELLKAKDPEVRRVAAHLSRSVQTTDQEMAPRLLHFLRDEDWWVRERVMDALVEMIGADLTAHIVPYLDDASPVIRRFAIGGLIRLRDPGSLGAILKAAVQDDDWWVREQAVLACAEVGDARAAPYLRQIALEREDLRLASLEALTKLQAHAELLELAELAGDADPDVRHAVLRALLAVPAAKEAAFYVQTCVNDPNPRVAALAQELLARWEITVQKESANASLGLLDRMLIAAVRSGADDLVLAAGRSPYIKRVGEVEPISKGLLSEDDLRAMLLPIMSGLQREAFDGGSDVDFSYEVKGHDLRFRANVFRQASGIGAVFRNIRQEILALDELGLPPVVAGFGNLRQGLVLIGGPTGSGKSTTLAALLDDINTRKAWHIVTIEDPIEVVHERKESLINQRELGAHAPTFKGALRATLRQDPDVILVGELRDHATIDFAVNAAETGHLVLGTVHTVSADATIDRMVHAYPASQHNLIRTMLAESLRAVVCQQLLRRRDDPDKRVLAAEVMINNDAISNLIRKNKTFQISSIMATQRESGMLLMDQELERLVRTGIIEADEALVRSVDKHAFAQMLTQAGLLDAESAGASAPPPAAPMPAPTGPQAPTQWSQPPPGGRASVPPPGGVPSFHPPSHGRMAPVGPGAPSGRMPAVRMGDGDAPAAPAPGRPGSAGGKEGR